MTTRPLLASLAIAAGMVVLPGAAGAADGYAPADSARAAGGFLAAQLAAHGHVYDAPGTDTPDLGVTIDAVLGLAATHTAPDEARAATKAITVGIDGYLGPGLAPTELYAGPLAKTALLAMTVGDDPHAFGDYDLLARLASLETKDGRYADHSAYGDTSNTYTQALALMAVERGGQTPPATAVQFLTAQQCADGGFRLFVESADCVSNPDATSMAAIALAGNDSGAAGQALDFLEGAMNAAGGIAGGVGAATPNTNTTGLAAAAFAVAGRTEAFERATGFLRSLQLGCGTTESVRGAIAYDKASYAALLAAGASATASDQERRATTQAAFGLAGASPLTVTLDGATPASDECASTPSSSSTSPTSPSAPTSTATVTTTVTHTTATTATAPAPAAPATPHPASTVTVTSTTTMTTTSTSGAGGMGSARLDGSGGTGEGAQRPSPDGGRADPVAPATAAASPTPRAVTGGRSAYLLAGGLVLAGAVAAARILTRGRTH